MIKIMRNEAMTNAYYPTPWDLTNEPFPAFRAEGQAKMRGFLPLASEYNPEIVWFSRPAGSVRDHECRVGLTSDKIIKTKKGGLLLVPCNEDQNERIALITGFGGFRSDFAKENGQVLHTHHAEILWMNTASASCAAIMFAIVRFTEDDGYVWFETGRRTVTGVTVIFPWRGLKAIVIEKSPKEIDFDSEVEASRAVWDRAIDRLRRSNKAAFVDRLDKINKEKFNLKIGEKSFSWKWGAVGMLKTCFYVEEDFHELESINEKYGEA